MEQQSLVSEFLELFIAGMVVLGELTVLLALAGHYAGRVREWIKINIRRRDER